MLLSCDQVSAAYNSYMGQHILWIHNINGRGRVHVPIIYCHWDLSECSAEECTVPLVLSSIWHPDEHAIKMLNMGLNLIAQLT